MSRNRPYQIVAGDDRDLEDVLRDRQGRVIGLDPYESVTVQAELEDGSTRLTLEGTIVDDETVAVDLAGEVDQAGRWALEWELRDGADQLLRTVPAEGTIPLVARPPMDDHALSVEGGETYLVAAGTTDRYDGVILEPDAMLAIESEGIVEILPDT